MKKLLCLLALAPMLSYAHPVCPQAKDIKSVGVNARLFRDSTGNWVAGRSSQRYNTADQWSFVIYNIVAKNNDDAYNLANKALAALKFRSGPNVGRNKDEWYCLYRAGKYQSAAITPPLKYNQPDLMMFNAD